MGKRLPEFGAAGRVLFAVSRHRGSCFSRCGAGAAIYPQYYGYGIWIGVEASG